jgi:hypothetical protein
MEETGLEIVKPKTFGELISILQQADNAMIEVTPEEMEDVGNQLAEKVDSLDFILSRMEAEEKRLDDYIEQFSASKKAIANKRKSLKDYIKFVMEKNGFEVYEFEWWHFDYQDWQKISGKMITISMRSSKSTEIELEPTAALYATFPKLIKREYAWIKSEVKKELEAGNKAVAGFAKITENKSVNFKVKKEF